MMQINTKKVAKTVGWLLLSALAATPVALDQYEQSGLETIPEFVVNGPEEAEVGSLVKLSVVEYRPSQVEWSDLPNCEEYGKNGSRLALTSQFPGEIEVTCSMIRGGKLYLTTKTVEFLGSEAPKTSDLGRVARKMSNLAAANGLNKQDALKMAQNLRQAVQESTTPRGLVSMTSKLNSPLTIPEGVSQGMKVMLTDMSESGELLNMEQHKEVWEQMAIGLEEYAG